MTSYPLRDLPVFQGVSAAGLARLETHLEERACRPNEIVYRVGDPGDSLYVVSRGAVLLRTEVPGEPIDRVLDVGTGELFGEMEVIEGSPRQLAARALGETVLVRIPRDSLKELAREQPVVETLLRSLAIRRRTTRLRAMLAPQNRTEPRIWVDREVVLTLEGGERVWVRLDNLSGGGAGFSAVPEGWQAGQVLSFSLGTPARAELLKVRAEVRWRHGGAVGVAFEAAGPAHRRRVEQALRELV